MNWRTPAVQRGALGVLQRRSGQLALQAALLLALEPEGNPRRIRELAAELGVATTYLTKVIQNLTRVGLLRAARGPGGGVQLARPAQEIHPWDVLAAVEPMADFTRCLLGANHCNEASPCPLHHIWEPARERIRKALQSKNLQEFAAEAVKGGTPFWTRSPLSNDGSNGQGDAWQSADEE